MERETDLKEKITDEQFFAELSVPLNDQQKEAVRTVDGPVLLLAVPGSGKTTVLVSRLGYMIKVRGIDPGRILTVTYTVAATKDMAARFSALFGQELADRLEFRTINGICAKIISWYGWKIGREPFELVTDEKMTAGLLSDIYRKVERSYPTESDLKTVRTAITFIKNRMLTQTEAQRLDRELDIRVSEIAKLYNAELKARRLMDYDDQMIYALNILRKVPGVLEMYRNRYTYLCMDEAQDTSRIQHEIAKLLAGSGNLFMVGDEDQSIYGFRAAYPEALLNFEKDHPGAKILFMEENFRSGAEIVKAADRFIRGNTLRRDKHMVPSRGAGAKIREIPLRSRSAQYSWLVKTASDADHQICVLYRDNESAVPLVDRLERENIPYRLKNADITFFTHRTVLDIENIIRFAEEPMDTELFLQIYYKIATYIKKDETEHICEYSRMLDIPVLDAAIEYGDLKPRTVSSVKAIRTHLQNLLNEPGDRAVNRILNYMGYGEYLNRAQIGTGKAEILKAVGAGVKTAAELPARMDELQEIFRNKENDPACPFILSTIHASKGLEYDTVYLMDAADGVFPESVPEGKISKDERETFEEERRLYYVGATRAKNELNIFRFGDECTFTDEFFGKKVPGAAGSGVGLPKRAYSVSGKSSGSGAAQRSFTPEEYVSFKSQLKEGTEIRHIRYGEGVVRAVDGRRVLLSFGNMDRTFDIRALLSSRALKFE